MSPERGEHQQPLQLTQAQELAAQDILAALRDNQHQTTLVVLEGLSGAGKSCLLGSMEDSVGLNNGRIVDPEDIEYDSRYGTYESFGGHFVTTRTVGEFEQEEISDVATKKIPGIEVKKYFLEA